MEPLNGASSYMSNFEAQLNELEMIQSMYSNRGEFEMDDPSIIADVRAFAEGNSNVFPTSRVQFTVNLRLEKGKFAVICCLPFDYPDVKPEVYVRSQELNRYGQRNLNEALSAVIASLDSGDPCIGFVLDWLKDDGESYFGFHETEKSSLAPQVECAPPPVTSDHFMRYWIYSHHIYNKSKRRLILDLAKASQLTGFCLPGKPGIICVEGVESDCEEFWCRVRQVPWKKIACLKKEEDDYEHKQGVSSGSLRRFENFEEVHFEVPKSNGRDFKMDMGSFYNFLDHHQCAYVFKDIFGIEGRMTNDISCCKKV